MQRTWLVFLLFITVRQEKQPLEGDEVVRMTLSDAEDNPPSVCFSADGKHVAYWPPADRTKIIVDGVERPAMGSRWGRYLPDGRLLFVSRLKEHEECVVIDGVAQATWREIYDLTWTPDGKKIAYCAWKAEPDDVEDTNWLVVDGKATKCPVVGQITDLCFDNKGRPVYGVFDSDSKIAHLVTGDGLTTKLDGSRTLSRVFQVGEHEGYLLYSYSSKTTQAILNGKPVGPALPGGALHSRPFFNAKGVVARSGTLDGKEDFVYVGDAKFGPYASAGPVEFSPDGACYAFAVSEKKGGATKSDAVITVDAKGKTSRHEGTWGFSFMPDNRVVYRHADGNKTWFEVDGKSTRSYEWASQPVFEATGKSMSFGAKDGAKLMWVTIKP